MKFCHRDRPLATEQLYARPVKPTQGPRMTVYRPKPENRTLTTKEQEVCGLVALGLRNKQIGAALGLSSDYVAQVLCRSIYPKVQVSESDNFQKRLALANWWMQGRTDQRSASRTLPGTLPAEAEQPGSGCAGVSF